MRLTEIGENKSCLVLDILAEGKMLSRLLELGFVYGTKIKVLKVTQNKATMLLCVKGYLLALGKELCDQIVVNIYE